VDIRDALDHQNAWNNKEFDRFMFSKDSKGEFGDAGEFLENIIFNGVPDEKKDKGWALGKQALRKVVNGLHHSGCCGQDPLVNAFKLAVNFYGKGSIMNLRGFIEACKKFIDSSSIIKKKKHKSSQTKEKFYIKKMSIFCLYGIIH